jgi:acetate---CoA ligase (ADP-forming)
VKSFLDPESVVLIGVPRQSGRGAYNNLETMLLYGYKGRIHVVHPKVPEILGHKTYPGVADLPETPELAIISVGRDRVLPIFSECAKKGIRHVIVISQGFADADEAGKALQEKIISTAREHGVRVLGPNTMGVLNAFAGFSTAFLDLERDSTPPPLSMIVQSGVFQVGPESFTGSIGKVIDIGNASDIDFIDALEFFENDSQTKVIALHIEGMKRGRQFLETAARVAKKKPIVILKTGRSTAGAQAALSHTGSLVGEDAIFDAAFARAGLLRVRTMVELRAVCQALINFNTMTGPRVAVVTATGACGIMTADALEDYRLELSPFPEEIREEIENPRIAWHKLRNPVDLWPLGMVTGSFIDIFKRTVTGLLKDDRVDAVFGIAAAMASPLHSDLDLVATVREIVKTNTKHKPIALWLYGGGQWGQCASLNKEPDVACFDSIDEAVMGLSAAWRYHRYSHEDQPRFGISSDNKPAHPVALLQEDLTVGEPALDILRRYGIPTVPGTVAKDAESAAATAKELGYPVVLKIISPEWLHKSDRGGIRLDLSSDAEIAAAYKELVSLFEQQTPHGTMDGILVQKQVKGVELLLGIKRDPQFGSVIAAGMGGIYTEIFRDVARDMVPVSHAGAERMLQSLRIYPILQGARGQKGIQMDSVVEAIVALSTLAMDHPEIAELDINPILASPEGCWCVDCRIVSG